MSKLAHGGPYPGREADEAATLALCNIQKAAALPHTRQQVSGVPPRAPPVASHVLAVPALAASAGVAALASTTREVDVPPVAPLAPETQEEPVAALAAATEMEDIDLPDANLAEAIAESERRDTDPDAARAPRKRRAVTNDDSDTPSQTSDAARPRKKAPRASRTSTTESGTTIAGTATQTPTKTTRRSTRSPAASRQPDEDASNTTEPAAVVDPVTTSENVALNVNDFPSLKPALTAEIPSRDSEIPTKKRPLEDTERNVDEDSSCETPVARRPKPSPEDLLEVEKGDGMKVDVAPTSAQGLTPPRTDSDAAGSDFSRKCDPEPEVTAEITASSAQPIQCEPYEEVPGKEPADSEAQRRAEGGNT
ncbi:putative uncharacterized protein DDB_G0290521 [Schistocerca cancellata]|uniref:putative uncharacterized protein DDB_G0290521 n=1 Tax=Schistocerca cancellata TaxID=274614 RepID=UPI002119A834|nr:putative uncharacterized protein DDB_G0290521 [Schistocerca cancellata]